MDSDILLFSAIVLLIVGGSSIAFGAELPGGVGDGSEAKYNVEGSITLEGTSDGAQILGNSFSYDTPQSALGLSFVGPNSDLSFTGAENVDVSILMRNSDGQVVDRTTKTIEELPVTDQETVDFRFPRKPSGDYTLEFDANFECTLITYGCTNTDSFETSVEVPR